MSTLSTPLVSAAPRQTLSRPVSAWRTAVATVIKDLQIVRRYLPDLIGNLVQLTIRVLFFLLFSDVIIFHGQNALSGQQVFIFLLGSLLLWVFISTALNTPLNAVSRDLMNGTLEYLFSNPISRYAYYVGTVAASALVNLALFVPLYLLMAIVSQAGLANMLAILFVCGLMLVTLTAMGVMIALLALLWRQVNAVAGVLFSLFEFLAGAYFPITQYPPVVQYAAYLLPFTWGYDLVRYYALQGAWNTLAPVQVEWVVIALSALAFTLLSRFLLRKVEQRAKQQGLHLI
jgi:ABC-2 type transport system permease protein